MTALTLLAGIWIILGLIAFGAATEDMTDWEQDHSGRIFLMCVAFGPVFFGAMLYSLKREQS